MADPTSTTLRRLDRLGFVLDNSIRIPVVGYRIGVDALLGLIPGVGDLLGLLLASYIVVEGARLRVPRATLLRMVANVGIEALVGAVPVLGDIFDATWKANARNVELVRRHVGPEAAAQQQADRRFAWGVMALFGLLVVGTAALAVLIGWGVWTVVTSA